jgi:hypothetical protein
MRFGSATVKSHLDCNTSGVGGLLVNNPWGPQDATKASWAIQADVNNDKVALSRRAPNAGSGVLTQLVNIDNVGHLTFKAMACLIYNATSQGPLTQNAWNTLNLPTIGTDSSSGVMPIGSSTIRTPATASWVLISASVTFSIATAGVIQFLGTPQTAAAYFPSGAFASLTMMQALAASTSIQLQIQPTSGAPNVSNAYLYVLILGGQ